MNTDTVVMSRDRYYDLVNAHGRAVARALNAEKTIEAMKAANEAHHKTVENSLNIAEEATLMARRSVAQMRAIARAVGVDPDEFGDRMDDLSYAIRSCLTFEHKRLLDANAQVERLESENVGLRDTIDAQRNTIQAVSDAIHLKDLNEGRGDGMPLEEAATQLFETGMGLYDALRDITITLFSGKPSKPDGYSIEDITAEVKRLKDGSRTKDWLTIWARLAHILFGDDTNPTADPVYIETIIETVNRLKKEQKVNELSVTLAAGKAKAAKMKQHEAEEALKLAKNDLAEMGEMTKRLSDQVNGYRGRCKTLEREKEELLHKVDEATQVCTPIGMVPLTRDGVQRLAQTCENLPHKRDADYDMLLATVKLLKNDIQMLLVYPGLYGVPLFDEKGESRQMADICKDFERALGDPPAALAQMSQDLAKITKANAELAAENEKVNAEANRNRVGYAASRMKVAELETLLKNANDTLAMAEQHIKELRDTNATLIEQVRGRA